MLPFRQMHTHFLWDHRPGRNLEHIAEHGMTSTLWEEVFHRATRHAPDKDDVTVTVAEGRVRGRWYRLLYAVLEDGAIVPLTVLPMTGFPIERRGLR